MGQLLSLAAKLEEKARNQQARAGALEAVREVIAAALWVEPGFITVVNKVACIHGRPLVSEEIEVVARYLDRVSQRTREKAK